MQKQREIVKGDLIIIINVVIKHSWGPLVPSLGLEITFWVISWELSYRYWTPTPTPQVEKSTIITQWPDCSHDIVAALQLLSHVWLFATPWTAALQASQSVTNSRSLFNSNPSSRWCHRTISSSVIPISSCLQSFPASGSFLTSQFFASGGQRFGISASASVLPLNIQD